MPVISPRPSSTSSTGGSVGGVRSSSTSSSRDYSSSYLNRGSTKSTSSSSYSPKYNYLTNSSSYSTYTPRTSLYTGSSSSSSYLSGGSSTLGYYRPTSSYYSSSLLGSNDSSSSSRYGLSKKTKTPEVNKKQDDKRKSQETTKRPPTGGNKRLSSSSSSSSLARLVATSGLDMYEKYSPAHYKPNCDPPSRCSSVVNDESEGVGGVSSSAGLSESPSTTHITLDRPRSRYSRLYSNEADNGDNSKLSSSSLPRSPSSRRNSSRLVHSSSASGLSNSGSSGDVTYTLRGNRLSKQVKNKEEPNDNISNDKEYSRPSLKNGISADFNSSSVTDSNGIDAQLKELKVSKLTAHEDKYKPTNNGLEYKYKISTDDNNNNNKEADNNSPDDDANTSVTLKLGSKVRTSSILPPSSPTTTRIRDRDIISGKTSSLYSSTDADISSKSSSNDEIREGLCGLRNIGNTCFMNSVIQCLSHTSELVKFLKSSNALRSSSTSSKDQTILNEFAKLIREMWTSSVHSVTPMELKRAFSTKHRMYSDYNQQDAQEFLRFFLDSLHSALNSGVKGEHLKIDDNLSDNKKADLTWEWYARHENSLIRDLFVGQLKSTLRCTTCGNTSVTFDPFWDLSVSLPSSSRCKLDACLDMFIKEEVLDGDEMPTCSKCRTRRKCTKSFSIQRFPKYLVIHLKRFSETRWSKLTNIVEFPTGERELNMASYGANSNSSVYYSLYGISNHMGSTAGGHYVALCKHPVSKKWHEFNDNIVSDSLSESQLVSSSAYILFYERA